MAEATARRKRRSLGDLIGRDRRGRGDSDIAGRGGGDLKGVNRERDQIDRDHLREEEIESLVTWLLFSAYDPHQETEDEQRREFELLHDCQTVQTIVRPSPFHEQAGEEGQEQDRHHGARVVHWPSSRPLPYFRISKAVRSKKILPVCSNFRISTDARACLPSDCLQISMRL